MKTLGASIVQRGIASMSDVEEALARQVMYGGDLATNLLELASVSEDELTQLLALSQGLDPAPSGELPQALPAVLRLVPGELAFRHGLYPLSEETGTLTVAVAEPLAHEVEQDLSFALGVSITQRAAPLVRIHQAVARDYKVPLDRRTDRIIAKLTGEPASLSEPPRVDFSALPRPETLPPSAYAHDGAIDMEAATGPPPEVYPISAPLTDPGTFTTTVKDPERLGSSQVSPQIVEPSQAVDTEVQEFGAVAHASSAPTKPTAPPLAPEAPALEATHAKRKAVVALKHTTEDLARRSKPPDKRAQRRLGPYTAADGEHDLMHAEDRDQVLSAFFDFASQYFEYCALFVMHSDLAEGRDARGPGATPEEVRALGIPLDLPSAMSAVYERGKLQLVRLTGGGIDAGLAKDLKRPSGPQCLLLPIVMRKRAVLILYGDHGESDVNLSDVGDVISFAPLVATGLERVILKRKQVLTTGERQSQLPLPMPPRRHSQAPLPNKDERARALVSALEAPQAKRPAPAVGAAGATQTGARAALKPQPAARPSMPAAENAPRTPVMAPHNPGPGAAAGETLAEPTLAPTHKSDAPLPPLPPLRQAEPRAGQPTGSAEASLESRLPREAASLPRRTPPIAQAAAAPVRNSLVPQRVLSIEPPREQDPALSHTQLSPGNSGAPPAVANATQERLPDPAEEPPEDGWDVDSSPFPKNAQSAVSPLSPEIAIGTGELEQELEDAVLREQRVPLAPQSRSVAYSARPPSVRHSSEELRLPSVIVDFESDSRALVERMCAGDPEAADKLLELGPAAVSALVSQFPGPLVKSSRGSDLPQRASDCGPVLRTLARIGSPAVPFLVVRTADSEPEVRAWATRLLGEMPTRDSANAVARRLVDSDPEVRRGALSAANMLQRTAEARAAIRDYLSDLAQDTSRMVDPRRAALEALAEIRDGEAVPLMIRMLDDRSQELATVAQVGLRVLTRADLGPDPRPWEKWWRSNRGRHRIEWLMDALMHDSADVRRAAGDELKNITKEYFGYYDDLPKKERAGAQARYREWWDTRGRSRFL